MRNMEVDPVLAFVAVGRVTEVDWDAFKDQDWFSYDYAKGKVVVLPAKLPMRRLSADGVEVREGGQPEAKPKYRQEFAKRGMSNDFAHMTWRGVATWRKGSIFVRLRLWTIKTL